MSDMLLPIYGVYRDYKVNRLDMYAIRSHHSPIEVDPNRYQEEQEYVGYWRAVSRVPPECGGCHRSEQGIPDHRQRHACRKMARDFLLAHGLHIRVPDRNRGLRQAGEGVPGARCPVARGEHRLRARAPG